MGGPGSGARPLGYAKALEMREKGMKSPEIGKALGVPASTVRNWFHRAGGARRHRPGFRHPKPASAKRRPHRVAAPSAEIFDRYLEVGRRLGFESAVNLLKAVREM